MRRLWFRTADPERVRDIQKDLPPLDPPLIQTAFGEKIVQQRREMKKALDAVNRGEVMLAGDILEGALAD